MAPSVLMTWGDPSLQQANDKKCDLKVRKVVRFSEDAPLIQKYEIECESEEIDKVRHCFKSGKKITKEKWITPSVIQKLDVMEIQNDWDNVCEKGKQETTDIEVLKTPVPGPLPKTEKGKQEITDTKVIIIPVSEPLPTCERSGQGGPGISKSEAIETPAFEPLPQREKYQVKKQLLQATQIPEKSKVGITQVSLAMREVAATTEKVGVRKNTPKMSDLEKLKREMAKNSHFLCHIRKQGDRYYLPVKVQGEHSVEALLDSGAEVSLISQKMYEELCRGNVELDTIKLTDAPEQLHNFNGQEVPVLGMCTLTLQIGRHRMSHPVRVVPLNSFQVLIGGDCLVRLSPLIDYCNDILWSQVRKPIPLKQVSRTARTEKSNHCIETRTHSVEVYFKNTQLPEVTVITKSCNPFTTEWKNGQLFVHLRNDKEWRSELDGNCLRFSLRVKASEFPNGKESECKQTRMIANLVQRDEQWFIPAQLNHDNQQFNAKIDFRGERSVVRAEEFFKSQKDKSLLFQPMVDKTVKGLDDPDSEHVIIGRAMMPISIGGRSIVHNFLIVKGTLHSVYVAQDILHRIAAFLDLHQKCLWARIEKPWQFLDMEKAHKSDQISPYVVEVEISKEVVIPANTKQATLHLRVRKGQELWGSKDVYVNINREIINLGLDLPYLPLVELQNGTCKILIDNSNCYDVTLRSGLLVGTALTDQYYTTDLSSQIIGVIPEMFNEVEGITYSEIFSLPSGKFSIQSVYPYEANGSTRYSVEGECIVFKINDAEWQFEEEMIEQEKDSRQVSNLELTHKLEEQCEVDKIKIFPNFDSLVQEQMVKADACTTDEERERFKNILQKYQDVFSKDSYDCGLTNLHVVKIETDPNLPPVFQRQYRLPLASLEALDEIIKNLEERKIIRKAHSTFNTPILAILKASGSWRLCSDLRKLNQRVHKSRWPLPYIDLGLSQVQGAKVMTTLDLTSAYWAIKVQDQDQHKLGFSHRNIGYCFERLPFGYINAGSEFNIFLTKALPDAQQRGTITYVDDVLVKSPDIESHFIEVEHVLQQLQDAGVKVSLQKAQWFRTQVNFLGHEITPEGLNPQKKRVEALYKLKDPTTIRELRSLLGLVNYSRKFIEDYADITQPLVRLLKKGVPWKWGAEQVNAVKLLKERMTNAPCLAYPIKGKEYFIEIGYSETCLSAVLYQKHDQQNKIISFASKALSPVELKFNECEKALLAAIWAIQYFRPQVQGEKIVIETSHQSLQYLQSDRVREGNLSNSRLTSWTMAMQSFPVEVRYAQNKKNLVAQGIADLHDCLKENCPDAELTESSDMEPFVDSPHKVHDADKCEGMPTVFVDGCAFHLKKDETDELVAGIGNAWVKDFPVPAQGYRLGARSSQVAELMAVYKAVLTAVEHKLTDLVIITDSIYVRNGFVEYLPIWKTRGMVCANNKPLKHANLIKVIDDLVQENGITVYWKKTKGHSKVLGEEKTGNDTADFLATQGAIDGEFIESEHLLQAKEVSVITRSQTKERPISVAQWSRETPDPDLISAQQDDECLGIFYKYLQDPNQNPISETDTQNNEELRIFMKYPNKYSLQDGLLIRTSNSGVTQWVVPKEFRGMMMEHAHNEITAGHRGAKKTAGILSEMAFWPHMYQDVTIYCKGCLTCAQFQPTKPRHRAPLQKRGLVLPWSNIQVDFIGPVVKSARGNKYMLTVTCLFTKWVECLPASNCKAETAALLLINHVFSRFGLPISIASDRGSSFVADVMKRLWSILGVKRQLHIAYHPASSGGVERYNQTIVSMLRKFVSETGRDWDLKLPLVLMAIRATPTEATKMSPFELMTGRKLRTPAHLLYKTSEQTLVSASSVYDYIVELRKHLQFAFSFAQKNLEKAADVTKTQYDLKTSKTEYQIGDTVYVFNYAKNRAKHRKFLPSWNGPYPIVDKLSPVVYKIVITKGQIETEKWVHANQIKIRHPQSQIREIESPQVQPEQNGTSEYNED